jgi:hypothetical protein
MRLHLHIAQAPAQDRQAAFAAVVFAHARACVIAVAMGDDARGTGRQGSIWKSPAAQYSPSGRSTTRSSLPAMGHCGLRLVHG